jgi:hypothetical protein
MMTDESLTRRSAHGEENSREEDSREEDSRKEDSRKEDGWEEDQGQEAQQESNNENSREEEGKQEAGWRGWRWWIRVWWWIQVRSHERLAPGRSGGQRNDGKLVNGRADLAQTEPDPLAELGLTAAHRAALDQWMGVPPSQSIDRVWAFVGRDPDHGCEPAPGTALTKVALVSALADLACREINKVPLRERLARRAIESFVALALVAAFGGLIRIQVVQQHLWGWGLGLEPTIVAARPLNPLKPILAGDLTFAYLPSAAGATADMRRIIGRRPPRSIQAGWRIDPTTLQLEQVVARSAITDSEPIKTDAVRVEWSTEAPNAARRLSDVVGRCAIKPVLMGDIIAHGNLYDCPPAGPK